MHEAIYTVRQSMFSPAMCILALSSVNVPSIIVNPCTFVLYCPVPKCLPLHSHPSMSRLALSCLAISVPQINQSVKIPIDNPLSLNSLDRQSSLLLMATFWKPHLDQPSPRRLIAIKVQFFNILVSEGRISTDLKIWLDLQLLNLIRLSFFITTVDLIMD